MTLIRIIPAGDIEIEDGAPKIIEGAQAVRQKLSVKFKFWLGEWFANTKEGIPYRRDVFIANPNLDVIAQVFIRVLRSEREVAQIHRFDLDFDRTERLLTFNFTVSLVSGETIVVTPEDEDFIIDVAEAA